MRGISLVNLGVLILLAALVLVFVSPVRQPVPPQDLGTEQLAGEEPGAAAKEPVVAPQSSDSASPAPGGLTSASQSPHESGNSSPAAAADEPSAEAPAAAAHPVEPLKFPDWPRPQMAFVVTGEQLGYFEPCGCTANQLGGMSRRADLFRQLTALGWEVRGLDAGSASRRSVRQAQIKFETMLTAMRELRYIAMGLGPEDLRLDPGFLISQHLTEGQESLAFVGANLTFYNVADLGTPLPFKIYEHQGMKIGITSILGEARRREVIPDRSAEDAANADIQWQDPVGALEKVVQQFDAENVSFRILLSQAKLEETRALAARFPTFDLIVTAPAFGDGNREPERVGSVRILQVGTQGKHAGVVGLYPDDAEQPVRFELVTLSAAHFERVPRMAELMQAYQTRLKDEQIALAEAAVPHPSGATFVGADKCGECHTKAYEIWKNTPHAHGFESLDPSHQRRGYERLEGVSRIFDPECLSCHVTGWDPQEYVRFQSGFLNTEFASSPEENQLQRLLAGNQCENCHGPGSRHIELIEAGNTDAAGAEVRVTLEQSRKELCVKCHDGENSPKFQFDEYWKAVEHYGKD